MNVSSSRASMPLANAPPINPPMLVPAATSIGMRCSSSHRMTPTCAMPRALPPPKATPTVGRPEIWASPGEPVGQQVAARPARRVATARRMPRMPPPRAAPSIRRAPHAPVAPFRSLIEAPSSAVHWRFTDGLEPCSPRIWSETTTCRGRHRFARRRAPESGCGGKGHVLYPIGRRCPARADQFLEVNSSWASLFCQAATAPPVFRRPRSSSGGCAAGVRRASSVGQGV